jgi:hypothetical protein
MIGRIELDDPGRRYSLAKGLGSLPNPGQDFLLPILVCGSAEFVRNV